MRVIAIFTLLLSLFGVTFAAQAQVARSQLTTNVVNHEPVDNLQGQYLSDVMKDDQVMFFTQITNLKDKDVVHRWFYQGKEMAAVTLHIGSNSWRTYSSKLLKPDWQGEWQVQVWQGDLLLTSYDFIYALKTPSR